MSTLTGSSYALLFAIRFPTDQEIALPHLDFNSLVSNTWLAT